MHSILQQHADSMGLQPWGWFAQAAGVADEERFDSCIKGEWARSKVAHDMADAQRLSMQAIPTLLVHRWRFDGLPPFDTLLAYVDLAKADSGR
jgi:predicted DsbA family dithiol-disulfide isomerase